MQCNARMMYFYCTFCDSACIKNAIKLHAACKGEKDGLSMTGGGDPRAVPKSSGVQFYIY